MMSGCTWHTSIVATVVILWMAAATLLWLTELCRRLYFQRLWNTWISDVSSVQLLPHVTRNPSP